MRKGIINKELREEILEMAQKDQQMRTSQKWDPWVDRKNTARMKKIIGQYGWPGKSLVGRDCARETWLLVQHADHDVEFQKQALELLKQAVAEDEAEKRHEAYLTDRVRVNIGQLQVYGTQFFTDTEGKFGPRPIEDIEHLEERRKEVGLEPFSEYEARMQKLVSQRPHS